MTQLGLRERNLLPLTYKGFHLIRSHGRVYGIPFSQNPLEIAARAAFNKHPAILTAATLDELESAIDILQAQADQPELIGCFEGYYLLRHRGAVHAVPQSAGRVDLDLADECRRNGVISGQSRDEVQTRIARLRGAAPVEFAGWLPIYEYSGNCGKHPQFAHAEDSPPGYRFTCSAPPPTPWRDPAKGFAGLLSRIGAAFKALWQMTRPVIAICGGGPRVGLVARARVLLALIRLFVILIFRGVKPAAIVRFLQSRHFQSQLLMAKCRGLVFLTSMPYTYGQNPWVIEIEDPTTLFFPLIQNGNTCGQQIADSPYFPIVKTLLESDRCKGILTHMRSTAQMVPTLFGSGRIWEKVFYAPLGVRVPPRWQRHDGPANSEPLHLVFINSWCQIPENFYVRGGLDVLEAFSILHERYPHLRLTLRTHLPALDDHFQRIIEQGWVRVINRFLPADEMDALLAESHIFLLPAARVHIVSLLQAMSYGLAVVASDGWGMEEYLHHERNGLIVKGRYGKTSWADEQAGMLREDYEPMYTTDPQVVEGLVEAVSRLVEDHELRKRLGQAARHDVETKYCMERWNQALREFFDEATGTKRIQNPESRIQKAASDPEESTLIGREL